MKNLLIISVFLIVAGCSVSKKLQNIPSTTFWKIQHDTVYIPRDTTFILPADSCLIQALIECDSTGLARISEILRLKNGIRVNQQIAMKDNILIVQAFVDTASIVARWMERQITVKEEKIVTVEKPVNYIKGSQWFFIYCGYLFCFIAAAALVILIIRIWVKKIPL
ncbi:MAG: hypothetical protein D4R67_12575 [Bacteroidetes bacterium]|nr:MAG: hypothetical protein D4R67_12575 [Bacteroidota bacterium]